MRHRVDFCNRWDAMSLLDYNRYYLHGLHDIARLSSSTAPWYLAPLPGIDTKVRAWRAFDRLRSPAGDLPHDFVGQYIVDTGDRRIKVAIDPHDNRRIASRPLLEWSDVYFKSNRWTRERYPSHVLPLVNGNGVHDRRTLARLVSLRSAPKEYDVTFISRLGSGLEHNLKVFEALSRLRCRKKLVAILYAEHGQDAYEPRLAAAGVTCVRQNLASNDLWDALAGSRVVFLRLGAKYCVPWRMIDLLAMGSAIVIDRHPFADWPAPLEEGRHFVSCFDARDSGPGEEEDYARVPERVQALLDNPALVRQMASENAAYFDRHAAPPAVAQYIVDSACAIDPHAAKNLTWSDAVAPWGQTPSLT